MSNPKIQEVSDASFEGDILKSSTPVLVDFWAPWCGPCRTVAPLMDEFANQYDGKLKIAKLNVDESSQVAMKYQVTSIPTFILFKSGRGSGPDARRRAAQRVREVHRPESLIG